MAKTFIGLGALNAFIAVAVGAFAAHGLKQSMSAEHLQIMHTAADYQFYHALGLVLIGLLQQHLTTRTNALAGWLMLAGIVLFSGSLYALALSGITGLGLITPFGGLSFLLAWLILFIGSILSSKH